MTTVTYNVNNLTTASLGVSSVAAPSQAALAASAFSSASPFRPARTTPAGIAADACEVTIANDRLKFLESERMDLLREANKLRSENTFLREKTVSLEKCLAMTETKHAQLKNNQEEYRQTILRLEQALALSKKSQLAEDVTRDKHFVEINYRYQDLLRENEKLVDRCKVQEEYLEIFRSSAEESERSRRNYFNDFTNAKLEKEYIYARLNKVMQEKSIVERERDEFKQHLDRLQEDLSILRSKDFGNDEKLQAINNVLEYQRNENKAIDSKLQKYRRKVKKYKGLYQETCKSKDELQKETEALRSKRQQDSPTVASQYKIIERLSQELVSAKYQIDAKESGMESLRQENVQLKNLVNQLNLYLSEGEYNKKMLYRELELKEKELAKRSKFINAILRSHLSNSLGFKYNEVITNEGES